jgi:hypothetical protein
VTTTTAPVDLPAPPPASRRDRFALAVRQFSAISVAGALTGLVVGGIGGRLAMMLLARLNPDVTGVVSDDGFAMGRFDVVNSLNLLAVGVGLGLFGAAVYAVLRALMIGPRWFQVLSVSVGPAVVVGEMLVHTDGVDYHLLDPAGLAIALFVLIPGVFAAALTLLSERWLRPGSWFLRAHLRRVAGALVVWVLVFPLLPLVLALAVVWLAQDAARQTAVGRRLLSWGAWPWLARALLAVVFVVSAVSLGREVQVLT